MGFKPKSKVKNFDKLSAAFRDASKSMKADMRNIIRFETGEILKIAIKRTVGNYYTTHQSIMRRYTDIFHGGTRKVITAQALRDAGLGQQEDGDRVFVIRKNLPQRFKQYLDKQRAYRNTLIGQSKATWERASELLKLNSDADSYVKNAAQTKGVIRNVRAREGGILSSQFNIRIVNGFRTVGVPSIRMRQAIESAMKTRIRKITNALADSESRKWKSLSKRYGVLQPRRKRKKSTDG